LVIVSFRPKAGISLRRERTPECGTIRNADRVFEAIAGNSPMTVAWAIDEMHITAPLAEKGTSQ